MLPNFSQALFRVTPDNLASPSRVAHSVCKKRVATKITKSAQLALLGFVASFDFRTSPFGLNEISVLIELALGGGCHRHGDRLHAPFARAQHVGEPWRGTG